MVVASHGALPLRPRIPWTRRLWRQFKRLLWPLIAIGRSLNGSPPNPTPSYLEERQAEEISYLQQLVRDVQLENEKLKSEKEVQALEIRLLTAVNQRNQDRVEAEQAEWANRIAAATGHKKDSSNVT